jgi:hypothetical protein
MQKGANQQLDEKFRGANRAQAGQLSPFSWWFGLPFDLDAPRLINSFNLEGLSHPFIREPLTRRRSTEGSWRPPQALELPRRWLRPCPSRHDWPCVVNLWRPRFLINPNSRSTQLTVVKSRSTWALTSKNSLTYSSGPFLLVKTLVGQTHGQRLGQTPFTPSVHRCLPELLPRSPEFT